MSKSVMAAVVFGLRKIFKKMVTIKLNGGLGNQMFQYAFGRAMSLRRGEELILDLSSYDQLARGDTPRQFKLDQFAIQATIINKQVRPLTASLLWRLRHRLGTLISKEYHLRFHPEYLKSKEKIFDGFFQSYKYFRDYENVIRKDFSIKRSMTGQVKSLADKIGQSESVSIHVRRGDYVSNVSNYHGYGVCPIEYYAQAIDLVKSKTTKPHFYIFSDDIAWVKKNLIFSGEAVYVSVLGLDETIELYLMSLCQYNIIANSTFSWWAAWLNARPDKQVIAPKKWTNVKNFDTIDLIPENWIRL